MKSFSLRNRIAFYFLGATAIMVLVLFITIYAVVHSTVYTHLDEDLNTEAREVFKSIVVLNDQFIFANQFEWSENEHSQIEVNPTFIQVADSLGNIIKKTGNLFEGKIQFDPKIKTKRYYNTLLSGKPTRQLQLPINNPNGKNLGFLIIAIPLEESALVLNNLSRVLFVAFPFVLVVLFFITRFFAGKSIEPVESVITTAEKISKENLDERIELPQHKDELYKLTSTINQLLDRLEDAVIREKQFTSDASHELRTPLSVIKGTLEVLIRKPRNVEHYEEKIHYCINEVNRMSVLIDQLLLLARYESGKINPVLTNFNLVEKIQNVLSRLNNEIEMKNINVELNEANKAIDIKADPTMTEIMLENIISNSLKYSEPGKQIEIDIEENQNKIICMIKDEGIGMSKEQVSRIFDRFYRADESRNSEIQGNGLGLSIVKKLSEIQNIELSIKSVPSKGTAVIIKFPLN